jgi:hypothetical protein
MLVARIASPAEDRYRLKRAYPFYDLMASTLALSVTALTISLT